MNDVKRWICDGGIETKPYGYNHLEEEEDNEQGDYDEMEEKEEVTTTMIVIKTMVILNS